MKRLGRRELRTLLEGALNERFFYSIIQGDLGIIASSVRKCSRLIGQLAGSRRVRGNLQRLARELRPLLDETLILIEEMAQGMDMQAAMKVSMQEMTAGLPLVDEIYDELREALDAVDNLIGMESTPETERLLGGLEEVYSLLGDALDLVTEARMR